MEKEPSAMATQAHNNQKLNSRIVSTKDNDMILGALISHKSGIDFMQNCDLPPPLKVFTSLDKAIALSTKRSVYSVGREDDDFEVYGNEGENEKLEILKALSWSQTRAREAEKAAAGLVEEKERLLNVFMKDSLQLFGYRQWVRLLEIQVSMLQSQLVKKEKDSHYCRDGKDDDDDDDDDDMAWVVALALCLGIGIASVGFAFGFRFWF